MISYGIKINSDDDVVDKVVVTAKKNQDIIRKTTIKIGKEMVVKPLNKQKMKHRDRRVIIHKIVDEGSNGVRVSVKFLDTERVGKVDVEDLDDIV